MKSAEQAGGAFVPEMPDVDPAEIQAAELTLGTLLDVWHEPVIYEPHEEGEES